MCSIERRHPEAPRFYQRGEGSREWRNRRFMRDPSLRLENGSAQDDS